MTSKEFEEYEEYERQKTEWYSSIHSTGLVEVEGCVLKVDPDPYMISSGDMYFTPGRNTGHQILRCRWHNKFTGVVFPDDHTYPYDTWECFKILSIDGETV